MCPNLYKLEKYLARPAVPSRMGADGMVALCATASTATMAAEPQRRPPRLAGLRGCECRADQMWAVAGKGVWEPLCQCHSVMCLRPKGPQAVVAQPPLLRLLLRDCPAKN